VTELVTAEPFNCSALQVQGLVGAIRERDGAVANSTTWPGGSRHRSIAFRPWFGAPGHKIVLWRPVWAHARPRTMKLICMASPALFGFERAHAARRHFCEGFDCFYGVVVTDSRNRSNERRNES
jgi:hypothetical protein